MRACRGCGEQWGRSKGDGLNLCPSCESHSSWCSGCEASLPRTEFALNPRRRNGLGNYCTSCNREKRVIYRYNLSSDDYTKLYRNQGGLCAICLEHPESNRLVVDHCHSSGDVRGLLCDACNTAIGLLMDSPEVVINAARYLENNNKAAVSIAA